METGVTTKAVPNHNSELSAWIFVGPVLVFLTLVVACFKPLTSTSYGVFFLGIAGVILCWQLRYRGLGMAATLAGSVLVLFMGGVFPMSELGWFCAIATSLLLSLTAGLLSSEEWGQVLEGVFSQLEASQKHHADQLHRFSEQAKIWEQEKLRLDGNLDTLSAEAKAKNQELNLLQNRLEKTEAAREEATEQGTLIKQKHADALVQIDKLMTEMDQGKKQREAIQQELTQAHQDRQVEVRRHQEAMEKALKKYEQLNHERGTLESTLNKLQQEYHQLQKQEIHQQTLLNEHVEKRAALEGTARSLENQLAQFRLTEQAWYEEKRHLQAEKERITATGAELTNALQHLQKENERLLAECAGLAKAIDDGRQEKERVLAEYTVLSQTLSQVQTERDQLKLEVVAKQEEISSDRAVYQAQALYKQMRDQFDQKSQILDQTRKELFHAQELAQALQRDIEEQKMDIDDNEKAWLKHVVQMENEFQVSSRSDQKELESLYSLITALLRKK